MTRTRTETRVLPGFEVREVDSRRHEAEVRALTYGTADDFGTVWSPGCFSDSLRHEAPVALLHHNPDRPFGKVVKHHDTPEGLILHIQFADTSAVPDARTAYGLLADGIGGVSVGFTRQSVTPVPVNHRSSFGSRPAKEMMHRARLHEISVVSIPAVPGTGVLALRGRRPATDAADAAEQRARRALARRRPRLVLAVGREREAEARSRLDTTLERTARHRRLEVARFESDAELYQLDVLTGHSRFPTRG